MTTFKDYSGRTWEIKINVATMQRLKQEQNINLGDVLVFEEGKTNLLDSLEQDPTVLCNMLYTICKSQIEQEKLSAETFMEMFYGELIESATNALVEEICNFFQPRKRDILLGIVEAMRGVKQKASAEAIATLNELSTVKQG